jgi:hypothetical protein
MSRRCDENNRDISSLVGDSISASLKIIRRMIRMLTATLVVLSCESGLDGICGNVKAPIKVLHPLLTYDAGRQF